MSHVKVSSRHWVSAAMRFRFRKTRTSAARTVAHVSAGRRVRQRGTVDRDCCDVGLPACRGFAFLPLECIYLWLVNNTVGS